MKLLRLELKNFRQHQNSEIEFQDGLTGIIGANGAGKTTLIEAISFALFGSKAIRGKVDDLKTRGTKAGRVEVQLSFEQSEIVYRIARSSSDAKLFIGGEAAPFVEGNRETLSRIQTILGMNHEEFIATFLTEQKGLEFLSGKRGAAERERFIVRMLGYDRLEKIQDKLRADRRDIKNTLVGSESSIGDRAELEEKLKEETSELKKIEPEFERLIELLEKQGAEVSKCKREFDERESRRLLWVKAQRNLEHLQIRHSESGKRLKDMSTRMELIKNSHPEEPDGEILLQNYKRKREEISWAKKKKEEITKRKESLEKIGAMGQCPTCGQELGSSHNTAVHDLALSLSDVEAEIREAGDVEYIDQKMLLLQEEQSLTKEILNLRDEIKKIDLELKEAAEKVKETRFSESEYLSIKGRYDAASELVELTRLQKVKAEGEVKTKRALLRRTEENLQSYDKRLQNIEKLRGALSVLEEGDIILTDFRKALNEEIKPKLSSIASEFISALTDGRYVTVEMGSDFSPYIVEDGVTRNVISGGEGDILNLSVRLALSHMLAERSGQQFSLLILDEIFGSLDENRRNNVLQLLERLGNRFEQILVITHMDDIKEGVEHLLIVDFDEDSDSTIVNMQSIEPDTVWW